MMSNEYIVRMRFEGAIGWLHWADTKITPPENRPCWASGMADEELVLFNLPLAREFVRNYLAHNSPGRITTYLQIRPFECASNDPRIEDYELGGKYDWEVDRVPEILIIIEGGLIQEIRTTLPRLRINVIDHDNGEMGDDPVHQYELHESYCNDVRETFYRAGNEAVEQYQRGEDDEAYEQGDEPYEWQL